MFLNNLTSIRYATVHVTWKHIILHKTNPGFHLLASEWSIIINVEERPLCVIYIWWTPALIILESDKGKDTGQTENVSVLFHIDMDDTSDIALIYLGY